VPATSAGEVGQDRSRSGAARTAHKEAVLAIKNDALYLSLRDVMPTAGLCRIRHSEDDFQRTCCGRKSSTVGIITGSPRTRGEGLVA